jgi:hypothetical protein
MSVLPTFLVTGAGTSAGFVTPRAAHTVLQRGSQQSAWGSSRRSLAQCRGRAGQPVSLLARRAGWTLLVSLDRPAARIRRLRTAEGGGDGRGRSLHCPQRRDGRRCIWVPGALAPSTRRARTASSARKIPLSSPGRHRRRSRSRSTRISCLPCVCWLSSSLLGTSGSVPGTGRRQTRSRGTGGCALVGSRTVRPGGRLPFDDRHRTGRVRPHASPASRRESRVPSPARCADSAS